MSLRHFASLGALAVACACGSGGGGSDAPTGPSAPGGPTTPTVPVVATVTVTGTASAQAGATSQLAAEAKDASGAVITSAAITWSSSDASIIAVSNAGLVTATRIGTATITATSGSVSGSVAFTSSLTPFTFNFSGTTSASDQQTIKDGTQFAQAYMIATFGRGITVPTTISGVTGVPGCAQGGSAAFTGPGSVTYCVANPGWVQPGPNNRFKIAAHEAFHVWQFQYGWLGNPATAGALWIIEGSAELVGWRVSASRNIVPFATAQGCQVKQVADFALQQPPGLPNLSAIESAQAWQTTMGPTYPLAMIGMDQLTTTPGMNSLRIYGDAIAGGTAWQTAFQTAFSTSLTAFYTQFPAYRAGLAIPPNYLCGG